MVLRITVSLLSGGSEEPLDGCSSSLSLSCSSQGPQAELKKVADSLAVENVCLRSCHC